MKAVKLKLDIENKILISFLSISFLFTGVFALILGFNGYRAQLEKELLNARLLLGSVTGEMEYYGSGMTGNQLLHGFEVRNERGLYIYSVTGEPLIEDRPRDEMRQEWTLLSRTDNRFGWTLCYIIDRADFYDELIESQKYMIIATIALFIITVQAGIFISYNISNPIRLLSETCESISRAPALEVGQEMSDTFGSRGDEIGMLAGSFSRMLSDIRRYTFEVTRMNALNKTIVENLPLGIVAYDTAGERICINSKARAMLDGGGYLCDGVALSTVVGRLMQKNEPVIDPIRANDRAGRGYDLEIGVWRLADENGLVWGALCTIDDITYKKMMEEKFGESEKLAYTGKISADLAHEIRNPLSGIRASIQVIAKRLVGESDKALCSSIVGEVDRINLLIENLLNIARERTSQKALLNVGRLFDEIALLYTKVAENSRIALKFGCEPDITLYADEGQIKQILINLINNSFKAMKNGGEMAVEASRLPNGIMLTVSDTGIGMTADEIAKVIGAGSASPEKSRGLGLSIVRRLLLQNGGALDISSTPGSGTRITMTFEGQE